MLTESEAAAAAAAGIGGATAQGGHFDQAPLHSKHPELHHHSLQAMAAKAAGSVTDVLAGGRITPLSALVRDDDSTHGE